MALEHTMVVWALYEAAKENTVVVWTLYALVGLALLGVSTFIVLYFQPRNGVASSLPAFAAASTISSQPLQVSSRFVNVICILALYVSFLCLFTAPVDVFLLENSLPHLHASVTAIKIMYEIYFGVLVVYSFFGAPLVFNYARQTEIAHLTMAFSAKARFIAALKRTLCFVLGVSLLLLMAMIVLLCGKPTSTDVDWLKPLLNYSSDIEMIYRLLIGIVVLCGLYLWIVVCSRGLASLPLVGLLMENHAVDENKSTFKDLLAENAMETQATMQTKDTLLKRYAHQRQMSSADQERLAQLKMREKILLERREVLEANARRFELSGRWRCWKIPIGVLLMLVSLLIVVSLLITSLDKMLHSNFRKGFLLNHMQFPNPIDLLLVLASRFFPFDYILFAVLFLYLFVVSFVMLGRHGVRVLCFRMDRLQPRLTSSSTMAIVSLIMIYMAMIGLFSMLTLAPQYATFGHQMYAEKDTGIVKPCTLAEAAKNAHEDLQNQHCRMSQLAQFYNSLAVQIPMFGLALFLGQLLFVFSFIPWAAHAYVSTKKLPDPDPKTERLLSDF
ncbi:TPA: hypothetical protein N0F65_006457 [Lagenidium giganteum]|uniref:Lysosomal cobalamin transporter n=1 Tax=Lagenidium giganteum TaxID=4803 RepID=A0AAV2YZP5_9STRA|nr:TPA: hypothetical protein N0F65_006457 [Lagenidium giganteum]